MPAYFTPAEVEMLQRSQWADQVICYQNVTHSVLSVLRHYAVGKVGDHWFTYIPTTDELIRTDVLTFINRLRATSPVGPVPQAQPQQTQQPLVF